MAKLIGNLLALAVIGLAQAAPSSGEWQSTDQQVSLLELYTSEGCSSCPPADQWLSGLKDDPRLWRQVVPVAFHVDYWDDLGWPDRFASPLFSERQRSYAQERVIRTPYTPGLIVHGQEWRGWFNDPELRLASSPTPGRLSIKVVERHADIVFAAVGKQPGNLEIHLAVLGFGLQTQVKAGENAGRALNHDFVVLGYARAPLGRNADDRHVARIDVPTARFETPRRALAAWVSRADDPRPLQAVGGWW